MLTQQKLREKRVEEFMPGVFHINYDSHEDLAFSFLRMSEYVESPEFKGKIFTLNEFRQWYTKHRSTFSYVKDWDAFNLKKHEMDPFFEGKFDPLSDLETDLLATISDKLDVMNYLLGTSKERDYYACLLHEASHALFELNRDYRTEVFEVLATIPDKEKTEIRAVLERPTSYDMSILDTEIHAHILVPEDLEFWGYQIANVGEFTKKLNEIFFRHYGHRTLISFGEELVPPNTK